MPFLGKVLEKHAKNEIFDFFETNGLFYQYQFGFRKNRSSFYANFQVVDNVTRWRNAGGYSYVAFLDPSKAFNCVYHAILIKKLQHYRFKGNSLKCLTSYLENRNQYTKLGDFTSYIAALPSSVPQGSILGPIFYLIVIYT